jgi:hypothetical protein
MTSTEMLGEAMKKLVACEGTEDLGPVYDLLCKLYVDREGQNLSDQERMQRRGPPELVWRPELKRFLRRELNQLEAVKEKVTGTGQDTIITVDRKVRPLCFRDAVCGYTESAAFKALELCGPASYDVKRIVTIENDKFPSQSEFHGYLVSSGLIARCLSLHDLEAINKKGADFYDRIFGRLGEVVGWRSLTKDQDGSSWVPVLYFQVHVLQILWTRDCQCRNFVQLLPE